MVVGDTTLKQIVPLLEKRFGDWKTPADAPSLPAVTAAALPTANRVYLIDQPGASQSNVYVAQLVPPSSDAGSIDFDFANGVLGGEFSSRLNMNLREDKHWAYGSYSSAGNALGQRPWFASAAVQTDKTAESIKELRCEITAFAGGQRAGHRTWRSPRSAPATRSACRAPTKPPRAVQAQVSSNLRYGRPDDYIVRYKARNDAMTPAL